MTDKELQTLVEAGMNETAGSVDQLAEEIGVSGHSLWGWVAGRRNPTIENLEKLAAVLEGRSVRLADVAKQLKKVAAEKQRRLDY